MKTAIAFFCLSVTAFGQQSVRFGHQRQPEVTMPSACGPAGMKFNVKLDPVQHGLMPPEAGKALVYFIHDDGSGVGGGSPTTRDAVDGFWVGVNQGESWFAVAVAPGEHHVCAALQSSFIDRMELAHFTAEAGKSYFFRTRLFVSGSAYLLDFEPADSDEAAFLISLYPMATATAKK